MRVKKSSKTEKVMTLIGDAMDMKFSTMAAKVVRKISRATQGRTVGDQK